MLRREPLMEARGHFGFRERPVSVPCASKLEGLLRLGVINDTREMQVRSRFGIDRHDLSGARHLLHATDQLAGDDLLA